MGPSEPHILPTGDRSAGRLRGRIRLRQLKRKSYQINNPLQLRYTSVNTQGWNWRLHRQITKTSEILTAMRLHKWDVAFLSTCMETKMTTLYSAFWKNLHW